MNDDIYNKKVAATQIINSQVRPVIDHVHQFASNIEKMKKSFINQAGYPKRYDGFKEPTASTLNLGSTGGSQMRHPLKAHLQKNLQDVQARLKRAEAELSKEVGNLKNAEMRLNAGMVGNNSARTLHANMDQALDNPFLPGNVGDINRVIWPFWFTTENVTINSNQSINANFTVTQEAAFVWTSYTRTVFLEQGDAGSGEFLYVDPDQPGAAGKSNGLSFDIQDSQSRRSFFDRPMDVNQAGWYKKPKYLSTPQLLLPNSNIAINWQNNNADNIYKAFITFYGYRVRIDHAQDILGTITG